MSLRRYAWWLGLLGLACGGGSPAPKAPDEAAPAEAAATTPSPASSAASTGNTGDGWEGESEAKGSAASGDAKPAAAAPANGPEETRTIEVITKLVKDHRPAARECYDKGRKEIPSLQGDLVVHFVLDPAGKVKMIELNQERSTLKSPAVVDCVIGVVKSIAFPPSSRGLETNVNYPFNFTPSGPPPH